MTSVVSVFAVLLIVGTLVAGAWDVVGNVAAFAVCRYTAVGVAAVHALAVLVAVVLL